MNIRRSLQVTLAFAILVVLVLFVAPSYIVEWLWLDGLSYKSVFWKALSLKAILFGSSLLFLLVYLGANYRVLTRLLAATGENGDTPSPYYRLPDGARKFIVPGIIFIALVIALGFSAQWTTFLQFIHAADYGASDPIFGRDLSFYLLQLPFIEMIQNSLSGLFFLVTTGVVIVLSWSGHLSMKNNAFRFDKPSLWPIGANAVLFLLTLAWGYFLDRYELLSSSGSLVYGAGFTDIHARLPALWIMMFATLVLSGLTIFSIARDRLFLIPRGLIGFAVIYIAAMWIAPPVVQQLVVNPNELEKEQPYLEHNISLTREAFDIDDVAEQSYPVEDNVSLSSIADNQETINNIRLWDPRLLIQTYRQIQEIRLYYQFYDVDVDRYEVDGEYRQVMLSARELAEELPERANTWVNRHLQYTHGYGLAMNLVAREGEEGTPELLIKDLPPVTSAGLDVSEPAIYYGEHSSTYHIVNSKARELDYPSGDENVYTQYAEEGGIALSNFGRRLLFAWYFGDINILLSDYITPESRMQFWKQIQERITRIAPFLKLDSETYLVLSEGSLYWVQDAYTVSNRFPYAEHSAEGLNYYRNSVKVIVNALTGAVDFYVVDDEDPVLNTYAEAFPDLFKPLETLSSTLKRHLRYPVDLFNVQVGMYNRYHMTDPQVFYNNEDLWTRPQEQYGGTAIPMEPYYILMPLGDSNDLQFLLMTPLTPENRDNMIAWIAAKSDYPGYGELVVYKLPKEKLIYGPNQVESKIDQDTEISQQLSLWDQRGSRVIRGNLIAVPIEQSFLYVEPVFLVAEETQIPQLRRVIVSYGERTIMQPTLDQALRVLFGDTESPPGYEDLPPSRVSGDLQRARSTMRQLKQSLQDGNYEALGRSLRELEETLIEDSGDDPR